MRFRKTHISKDGADIPYTVVGLRCRKCVELLQQADKILDVHYNHVLRLQRDVAPDAVDQSATIMSPIVICTCVHNMQP